MDQNFEGEDVLPSPEKKCEVVKIDKTRKIELTLKLSQGPGPERPVVGLGKVRKTQHLY